MKDVRTAISIFSMGIFTGIVLGILAIITGAAIASIIHLAA